MVLRAHENMRNLTINSESISYKTIYLRNTSSALLFSLSRLHILRYQSINTGLGLRLKPSNGSLVTRRVNVPCQK